MKRNVKAFLTSAIPAIIAVLLSAQTDEILGQGFEWYEDASITQNQIHKGKITDDLVHHLMKSSNCDQLGLVKTIKRNAGESSATGSKSADFNSELAAKLEEYGLQGLKNSAQLESAANPGESDTIIRNVQSERNGALDIAKRYAGAVKKGDYAVILDNEGDDLAYLWMAFEDGRVGKGKAFPKVIITYGGYTELRFRAVEDFVTALCDELKIKDNARPKVYRGFPTPYPPGKERATYDELEGSGYIEETHRQELIQRSKALENELKDDEIWKENWTNHEKFAEGIEALGELIDNSDYTAIAVLTCPAVVAHVINQRPDRAKKIGVTMSSPWAYSIGKSSFEYAPTFNSSRQIAVMNELLRTGVDFLGVGGGTALTKGMRTIHDALHGTDKGEGAIYAEKGIQNLEKVVSNKSKIKFLKIMAHAGENVANAKWSDWDLDFQLLWHHLNIGDPTHPALAMLREQSGRAVTNWSQKVRALEWPLDKMFTLFKLWVIWKNPVKWQAPSADLHAVITTSEYYITGITGAARYTTGNIPGKGGLVKFVKPNAEEEKVHYSISDMNFNPIINRFQEIVNKYAA